MKKLSFREVQVKTCDTLRFIDKICREQGFNYFVAYGSLIGVFRHGGYIPWDDDIDIVMPRTDYEKFKKYSIEHADELLPFKWFDPDTVEGYPHNIARMSDTRYKLEFDNERDYGIGLFVDIYPFDGLGDDLAEANRIMKKTKRLCSLCFLTGRKKFGRDNTKGTLKMMVKYPAYLYARLRGTGYFIKKINKLSTANDVETSKYVSCPAWHSVMTIFDRNVFETMDAKFEDFTVKVPVHYDDFLKGVYGDYMTPPPEDDRKTHHTYDAYEL